MTPRSKQHLEASKNVLIVHEVYQICVNVSLLVDVKNEVYQIYSLQKTKSK